MDNLSHLLLAWLGLDTEGHGQSVEERLLGLESTLAVVSWLLRHMNSNKNYVTKIINST